MTAVSLTKGGNVSLTKSAPGLENILVGLGWDERSTNGADFDLDASVLLLNSSGKVRHELDFIFYNNLETPNGSVIHTGDNLTGDGDGDDEAIRIALSKVDEDVTRMVFVVTIHDAEARGQNFGQVRNASIRVVNEADNAEITNYDLSEDACSETAMIFAELYRHAGEWKFKAVGQGYAGGLKAVATDFGIQISSN